MSCCVSVYGIIEFKKVPNELPFKELKKADEAAKGKIKDNVINFEAYCTYPIIEYFKKYINDNLKNINMSYLSFNGTYEGEPDVKIETIDDEYYEQWTERHIAPEWFAYTTLTDEADELKETSKIKIKERENVNQQSTPNISNKHNGNINDGELPF
jgi:endo-1,4-beta-D-glucanase Y